GAAARGVGSVVGSVRVGARDVVVDGRGGEVESLTPAGGHRGVAELQLCRDPFPHRRGGRDELVVLRGAHGRDDGGEGVALRRAQLARRDVLGHLGGDRLAEGEQDEIVLVTVLLHGPPPTG